MTSPGDAYRNLPRTREVSDMRSRHLAFFRTFARRARDAEFSSERDNWAALLATELDNVRAALAWALEVGDAEAAQDLAASCLRQWERSRYTEGRLWLGRSLAFDTQLSPERVRALLAAAELARVPERKELVDEAVAVAQQLGDPVLHTAALTKFGWERFLRQERAESEPAFERAVEVGQGLPAAAGYVANALRGMAWLRAAEQTPLAEVSELLARARDVLAVPGFEGAACVHLGLQARLLTDLGDHLTAERLYTQKLAIETDPGLAVSRPDTLLNLGDVKQALGQRSEARQLWGEILADPSADEDNVVRAELRLAGLDMAEADLETAERRVDHALAIARESDDALDMFPNTFPLALGLKSQLAEHAGDPVLAERLLEERRACGSGHPLALLPLARHAARCGDGPRAQRVLASALEKAAEAPESAKWPLAIRALLAELEGDLDEAWALQQDVRGDRATFPAHGALNAAVLARLAVRRGDAGAARELVEAALPVARSQAAGEGELLLCLVDAELIAGDAAAAADGLRELLPRWPEVGGATAWVDLVETVARTAVAAGRVERGAELLGLADAERERIVYPRPDYAQVEVDAAEAAARASTGDELFEEAKGRGRRMDLRTEMWTEARS